MDHPELERLRREFGWVCELEPLSINNALLNRNWIVPQSAYSEDQTAWLNEGGSSGWWYDTRNQIIRQVIGAFGEMNCLWDVGSGPGIVSSYLSQCGFSCIGIEPSRSGVLVSAERGVTSIASDFESLQLPSESITCVGLFDVLEHVSDRTRLLQEIQRTLNKEGILVITVPALTWLWSKADEDVGHYLRYSRRTIKAELSQSGFKIQSSRYMFLSLVFPLLILRVIPFRLGFRQPIEDAVLLSKGGGLLSKLLGRIEKVICRIAPLGSSLIVVAKKQHNQ